MIRLVSILSLITLLAACGSEDENLFQSADLDKFKGIENSPLVSDVQVSNGQSISINSRAIGNVEENGSEVIMFTPVNNGIVLFKLESTASDLDLIIEGTDSSYYQSSGFDSDETIVITVESGITYSIGVEAFSGFGEFYLTVVEGNRSSIGLNGNEFFVSMLESEAVTCNNDQYDYSYEEEFYYIINFKEGYLTSTSGSEALFFDQVDGSTFTVSFSHQGDNSSYTGSMSVTVNLDNGSMSGSSVSQSDQVNGQETVRCNGSSTITGNIIL